MLTQKVEKLIRFLTPVRAEKNKKNKNLITETCFRMFDELLQAANDTGSSGEDRFYDDVFNSLHQRLRVLPHRAQMSKQRR